METMAFVLVFSQVLVILTAVYAVLRVEYRSGEERKILLARMDQERLDILSQALQERKELYTRIQAWEIPKPENSTQQIQKDPLDKIELKTQGDGTLYDPATKKVFESEEEARAWRKHLKAMGLPMVFTPEGSEML